MANQLNVSRRRFLGTLGATGAVAATLGLFGCENGNQQNGSEASQSAGSSSSISTSTSDGIAIDSAAWSYDSDNDVYYQIGLQYCESPQAPSYESMGIYVPGAYFDAKDNGNGTFTCTPSSTGTVAGYTAATAPIVMPINTAGYSAQSAPTSYSANGLSSYLEAGFVYVYAGCRGRKMDDDACGAAPWGVTDLKAAVRTLRYNADVLAGDTERIFSFGHSGGGAQSAVLGVSGDAARYDDYLSAIGAPTVDASGNKLSDAIYGAMCWCPITCLIGADMAYEWNMGQFASSSTRAEGTFTRQLSQDLAAEYKAYINALGLVDENGSALALEDGGEGITTAGSYYDLVMNEIQTSLNNFLADTEFPYTPSNSFNADMGAGGGGMGGSPSSGSNQESSHSSNSSHSGSSASMGSAPSGEPPSGMSGGPSGSSSSVSESTTYESAADYIAALNSDTSWIEYDEASNTATVLSLAGFVNTCKSPSKSVGAFDALDRSQAENQVFGSESTEGLHFDATMAVLLSQNANTYATLSDWDSSYPDDYASDRKYTDAQGKDSDYRQELYDPMYFLSDAYEGCGTSTPAPHWRIRTGITQGDTASTTEINLKLGLAANKAVKDVDFATVWGQGHTMAERTGSSTDNFITWVNDCCK